LWDRFFALKAQSLGDAKEIESVDLQIKIAKESLPSQLTWDTQSFQSYVDSGEDQRDTRYRLLTFTRLNLLRMILRHNPLMDNEDDIDAMRLCGDIAVETVRAIVVYMDKYNCVGPLGHFAATTLVECICHLVPSLAATMPQSNREQAISTITQSHQLLQRISVHRGAAKRANKILERVFDAVNRMSCSSGSQPLDPMHDLFVNATNLMGDPCMVFDDTGFLPLTPGSLNIPNDWLLDSFFSEAPSSYTRFDIGE